MIKIIFSILVLLSSSLYGQDNLPRYCENFFGKINSQMPHQCVAGESIQILDKDIENFLARYQDVQYKSFANKFKSKLKRSLLEQLFKTRESYLGLFPDINLKEKYKSCLSKDPALKDLGKNEIEKINPVRKKAFYENQAISVIMAEGFLKYQTKILSKFEESSHQIKVLDIPSNDKKKMLKQFEEKKEKDLIPFYQFAQAHPLLFDFETKYLGFKAIKKLKATPFHTQMRNSLHGTGSRYNINGKKSAGFRLKKDHNFIEEISNSIVEDIEDGTSPKDTLDDYAEIINAAISDKGSKNLFNQKGRVAVEDYLNSIDASIKSVCQNNGDDLHHSEGLVNFEYNKADNPADLNNLKNNPKSVLKLKEELIEEQLGYCTLKADNPVPQDSKLGLYALEAGGALLGLSYGIRFLPLPGYAQMAAMGTFGVSRVFTFVGSALTAVGGIETYGYINKLNRHKGLYAQGWGDIDELLSTQTDVNMGVALTTLDMVLAPLGLITHAAKVDNFIPPASTGTEVTSDNVYYLPGVDPETVSSVKPKAELEVKDGTLYYFPAARTKQDPLPLAEVEELRNYGTPQIDLAQINSREELLENLTNYDPSSDIERMSWIYSKKMDEDVLYLDIENAAMKRINDLGDKDFVTAITNAHKSVVKQEIDKLALEYPGLEIKIYSDAKSIRFAIGGAMPPGLDKKLNAIFTKAGKETEELVLRLAKEDGRLSYPGENIRGWFSGGIGVSAEQAGISARAGRKREPEKFSLVNFKNVKSSLLLRARGAEKLRIEVTKILPFELLEISTSGRQIPKKKVLALLLKSSSKGKMQQLFRDNYNLVLSNKDIDILNKYTQHLKSFEPGLRHSSREIASLEKAPFGGVTIDSAGMGSYNLKQIANDLTGDIGDMDELLARLRLGEQIVTQTFKEKQKLLTQTVRRVYNDLGIPVKINCSGDDCVIVPERKISFRQNIEITKRILKEISRFDNPGDFRSSFVRPGTPARLQNMIGTHGELIEKSVKANILKLKNGIPEKIADKMTIGIVMPRSYEKGKIAVVVSSTEDLSKYRDKITQLAQEALESFNHTSGNNTSYRMGRRVHFAEE